MSLLRVALALLVALSLGLSPAESWARRGGGHGGPHHHHHGRVHGAFVFGFFPWPYFYYPPPYYYGPDYGRAQYAPPTVYVERFSGTPTPQTPGEFFCPDPGAFYPDVQACATGWQRVIRPPQG